MAIYRFSAQVMSRATGRSVTAAAAYRSGSRIEDVRSGQVHDYRRRSGILHEEILLPERTPSWMGERGALWNSVEAAEKRKDAQLSREVVLSLPHELNALQRLSLAREYVLDAFVSRGMIADLAIHAPHRMGDDRNFHAHVMLTMREITGAGFGNKNRAWNDTALLEHWRETWERAVNGALERAGHDERIDHRSIEDRHAEAVQSAQDARAANDNVAAEIYDFEAAQLDRDPAPKIGHIAMALERRGEQTRRGDFWREVLSKNLDRFSDWIRTQRERVQALYERLARAYHLIRQADRPEPEQGVVRSDTVRADIVRADPETSPAQQSPSITEREPDLSAAEIADAEKQARMQKLRDKIRNRSNDRER